MAGSSSHICAKEMNLLKDRIEIVIRNTSKFEFPLLSSFKIQ